MTNNDSAREATPDEVKNIDAQNIEAARKTVDAMNDEDMQQSRDMLQRGLSEGRTLPDMIKTLRMGGSFVMAEVGERMLREQENTTVKETAQVEDPQAAALREEMRVGKE